jgi:hypothetical protein
MLAMSSPLLDAPSAGLSRRQLLQAGAAAALPALAAPAYAGDKLIVGGLPVTCNLTLPVACSARAASNKVAASPFQFEYSKYNGWPEIKESLMTGSIQAAYMLAPLVMDLTDKKIPVKIVSLGHRSGAVIMVRTDSSYKKFKDQHDDGARAVAQRDDLDGDLLVRQVHHQGRQHVGRLDAARHQRFLDLGPAVVLAVLKLEGRGRDLVARRAGRAGHGQRQVAGDGQAPDDELVARIGRRREGGQRGGSARLEQLPAAEAGAGCVEQGRGHGQH